MKSNFKFSQVLFSVLLLSILFYCKKETLKTAPVVSITPPSGITANSAIAGGNVTADGGDAVTSRGVCWSTGQNPTTADSRTSDGSGLGSFSSSITGLNPGVTYTLKAYAINSVGTSYSSATSFSSLGIAPTITTSALSGITSNSGVSGGNISNDGGSTVIARGVCWSTNQNPSITDSKTNDGTGAGSFISTIIGLSPGTTYYVRAYATNSITTSYGIQSTLVTLTALPTLTTTAPANITATTLTGGGNISSDGGAAVSVRGVCWSTNQNPTTVDSKTTDGAGSGSFTSSITGLNPGLTYYFRAYATNLNGTAYGTQVNITLPGIQPMLTTSAATSVTSVSAVCGGNISTDGGAAITVRGVCWSTSQNPTITDNKTNNGTGTGSYISAITGLTPGITYYIRAYATNSIGTAYGSQVTITASSVLPSLTTITVSSITAISAIGGGNISNDGGASVTVRGVCWSTSQSPTVSDSKTSDGGSIGTYNSNMTGLNGNTTYYVRAYATNSQGTAYGNEVNFKTSLVLSPASLTTTVPTSITSNSALLGGSVTLDGNATVTERGVCYSTSQSPTTSNNKVGVGTGVGTFSTTVSGFTSNTTYYVRAYAINSQGTAYGNEMSFKTNIVITPASLTTSAPTSITCYSMVMGGNVTSDGNATVTERGVYYSTSQSSLGSKLAIGNGTGAFSSTVSGLSAGTTYYIRAFAINNQGTAYGNQVTTTTASLPVINTNAISTFTSSTATTGGNVINDSGAPITTRGVCWSTVQSPTTADNITTNGFGVGGFTSSLTGLSPNTTYYIRAFATNSNGTAYGNQVVFTTDPNTVADIDGNSYNVVRIGTQLWMAENLKTTTYNNGSVITMVSGNSAWSNLSQNPAYCWYNNDPGKNKDLYGALYNYYAVETEKLCPVGWSVASLDDWATLNSYLGITAGGKLKETGTAHWISPNSGATNETGFKALPGGFRRGVNFSYGATDSGFFYNLGNNAFFWARSSTSYSSYPSSYLGIAYDSSGLFNYSLTTYGHVGDFDWGFSVRCVKN